MSNIFVGEIRPPSGTQMIFLNGTTARIKWTLIGVADIEYRKWSFTSSDGKIVDEILATIIYDNPPVIKTQLKIQYLTSLHFRTTYCDGKLFQSYQDG